MHFAEGMIARDQRNSRSVRGL